LVLAPVAMALLDRVIVAATLLFARRICSASARSK
jgi:hypothetical protein